MAYKFIEGSVTAAKGFKASGIHCGIRKNKSKRDIALIYSEVKCTAAAVYTTNLVQSSPKAEPAFASRYKIARCLSKVFILVICMMV